MLKLKQAQAAAPPMDDISIPLFDMMDSLSTALDLINPALDAHHKTTCYVVCRLANQLGLPTAEYNDLFAASVLHDIGAIALADRLKLLEFEQRSPHLHGELGYVLLSKFRPFAHFAPLVRFHHVPWEFGRGAVFRGHEVPRGSHLIHLADRIAVLAARDAPIFSMVGEIREKIGNLAERMFVPEMVDAFLEESRKEVFWLDMTSASLNRVLTKLSRLPDLALDLDSLLELSRFYSLIIDTRSRFTATHSGGVAASAEVLARLHGPTDSECKKYKIAGYLHDIGKLSVPETILEKNGELDLDEWRTVRAHSYHTWQILDSVDGLKEIATWAADHHENLDGEGYPFRHKADNLPLGSRILAAADVFTALAEDRPYRSGMEKEKIIEVMRSMVMDRKLDRGVVEVLVENFDMVQATREAAQLSERLALADFWDMARESVSA